jgi:hypothetical protein
MGKTKFAIVLTATILTGCATPNGSPEAVRGTTGAVEWELADVGRIESSQVTRWSYVIVLRETAGTGVNFEHVESTVLGEFRTGGPSSHPYRVRLPPRGEVRYPAERWISLNLGGRFGGVEGLRGAYRAEYRFVGSDDRGTRVVLPVRFELDRRLGRPSRQPKAVDDTGLTGKLLDEDNLSQIVGTWQGFYELEIAHGIPPLFVPIEIAVAADGSVDLAAEDPVTARSRGSVAIRDRRVSYAGRAGSTGRLTYYEGGSRSVLSGELTTVGGRTHRARLERASGRGDAAATSSSRQQVGPPTAGTRQIPAQIATATGVGGTYSGILSGQKEGAPFSASLILTLQQAEAEISGTWAIGGGGAGTVTGTAPNPGRVELVLRAASPCEGEFRISASLGGQAATMGGSYSGRDCRGSISASFSASRQ